MKEGNSMYKSIGILIFFILLSGCGRVGSKDNSITTFGKKSSGDLEFITVKKSHFVSTNTQNSGYYQTIIKTIHKPDIYASDDQLEIASNYSLIENNKHKEESKISILKSNNEVNSEILLLLDLSGSIISEGCSTPGSTCRQLINSTMQFIDNIVGDANSNFQMAIYYFNAKKEIMPLSKQTEFPTGNATLLKNSIKQLNNPQFIQQYLQGYENSTNLYGAVKQSGEKICDWIDCQNKSSFEMGSVVVFTDGRDLADIISKKDMLKSLKDNIQYYTIGIGDADNKTLIEISTKAHHFEASQDNIQSAFTDAYNNILYNSSFYQINYCPSTQEGSVRIKIFFDDKTNHIRAYTKEDKISLNNLDLRCDLPLHPAR